MGIEGVIRPPPEIRVVADKTALYVAKNGRAFESRILGSGKGKTPKFAFLQTTSPFHAYYEDRIQFYENGGEDKKEGDDDDENNTDQKQAKASTDETAAGGAGKPTKEEEEGAKQNKAEAKKGEKSQKSSAAIDPVAKALLAQRNQIAQSRAKFQEEADKQQEQQPPPAQPPAEAQPEGIPPPPPPRKRYYTPPAPPALELVQIVAPASLSIAQVETIQLVAQFTALDGKGGPFFTKLQHREWINPGFSFCQPRHGHFAYFSALVDAYRRILDRWTAETPDDGVQDRASNVDQCLETAAYRVEYERDLEEQARKQKAEAGGDVPEIAPIDWHDFVVVETIDFPADEKVELAMLPPPPPPKASTTSTTTATTTKTALGGDLLAAGVASAAGIGGDMDESDDDEDETIRVVPSYTPKVVSTYETNNMEEVIDPITGKSVPVKDMPEHMRIQLLDPKWAEERKKFQDKQKDSNLVSGDVIASNISRLNRDTYGKTVRCAECVCVCVERERENGQPECRNSYML